MSKWKVVHDLYTPNPHMPWPPIWNGRICTTKTSSKWRGVGPHFDTPEKAYKEMLKQQKSMRELLEAWSKNFPDEPHYTNMPIYRIRMHQPRRK